MWWLSICARVNGFRIMLMLLLAKKLLRIYRKVLTLGFIIMLVNLITSP
jgi:hypothetical protein